MRVKPQQADPGPAAVYLMGLAPSSQASMRSVLGTLARMLAGSTATATTYPWHQVTYLQTQRVRAILLQRYSPPTARKMLSGLRGVLRTAWRLGMLSSDDYQRAVDVDRVRGSMDPAGRRVDPGEIRALFEAIADEPHEAVGARDAAVLALLYGAGLRRAEVVSLNVAAVRLDDAEVRVIGKGRKERVVPIGAACVAAIRAWLDVRGRAPGPLFVAFTARWEKTDRRLSGPAVGWILARYAKQAGVECTPHDMRRTYVSELLDGGADIALVQRLVGHASTDTTSRYDRRDAGARRRAVGLLHVPYSGGRAKP